MIQFRVGKLFTAYEASLKETTECVTTQKDVNKDPFLLKIQFYDTVKQLNQHQKDYNKQLDITFIVPPSFNFFQQTNFANQNCRK